MTLDEAIEIGADECHCPRETMVGALHLMMPGIRNSIIEECAQFIDDCVLEARHDGWDPIDYAAALRALKDKP